MKKLLPLLLLIAGLGAGVAAGKVLGPPAAASADGAGGHGEASGDDAHGEADGHGAPDAKAADAKHGSGHGGGHGAGMDGSETEYARLNNQFIVPIVKGADVTSMVVLSLTLEVVPGGTETVFEKEPRIRDSFLQVLFDFANMGGFDAAFTEVGRLTVLRRSLHEAAAKVLGADVKDILITDIVRQQV